MWLVGVGGIYGCGCKEVYRFPHTTYPYSSCICSFLQQQPYFLFFFYYIFFGSYSSTFFNYVLYHNNFFPQYKHITATTGVPRHPYEGCTYCFIHEQAHTNVRFLSCDGHQLYERGVDLEVEALYRDASRASRFRTGPASCKGQRSRAESMHATSNTYTTPET